MTNKTVRCKSAEDGQGALEGVRRKGSRSTPQKRGQVTRGGESCAESGKHCKFGEPQTTFFLYSNSVRLWFPNRVLRHPRVPK